MAESGTAQSASAVGRRSRHGCLECRKRRKKCDEGLPVCSACGERGAECIYPRKGHTSTALIALKPATQPGIKLLSSLSESDTSELIHHFDQTVSNLISFSRNGATNPFFTNVLPLIPDSKLVRSAIETVASAHLAVLGSGSQFDAQHLQSRTLGLLAHEINRNESSDLSGEQLLATTLLLIYYEVPSNLRLLNANLTHPRLSWAILYRQLAFIYKAPKRSSKPKPIFYKRTPHDLAS